jgi:hypothetical protein
MTEFFSVLLGVWTFSGFLNTRKRNVSETESLSVLRFGGREIPTLLGTFERANFNYWTIHATEQQLFIYLTSRWFECYIYIFRLSLLSGAYIAVVFMTWGFQWLSSLFRMDPTECMPLFSHLRTDDGQGPEPSDSECHTPSLETLRFFPNRTFGKMTEIRMGDLPNTNPNCYY